MSVHELPIECRNEAAIIQSPASSHDARSNVLWIAAVLAGSTLLSAANATIDPFFVSVLFLLAGGALNLVLFPSGWYEQRAFLLSYGACVLVAGLAQYYSLSAFATPQSTIDANTFFDQIAAEPPFTTARDIQYNFNSPLAVLIWQQAYKLTWWLGLDFGAYIGVLLNGLVVGLTGSMTVRVARELFGNDSRRLRRVGTFYAPCGMFLLFGAVFIRDGFTLFLNVVVLWALVRWLCRSDPANLLLVLASIAFSSVCMLYLRKQAVALLMTFAFLAFLCWYWGARASAAKALLTITIPVATLLGCVYLHAHIQSSLEATSELAESYASMGEASAREGSIGMQLIVRQALPVRVVLGSGAMLVYPIPLWAYIQSGASEYHLIRSWQGLYQVLIMPLVLAGFWMGFWKTMEDQRSLTPVLFLASYSLVGLLVTAAITLEGRHFGQFLPAFLLLAVLPDMRNPDDRRRVRQMAFLWGGIVVAVHLAWAALSYR